VTRGCIIIAGSLAQSTASFRQRDLLQAEQPGEVTDFGATHAICSEVLGHLDEME